MTEALELASDALAKVTADAMAIEANQTITALRDRAAEIERERETLRAAAIEADQRCADLVEQINKDWVKHGATEIAKGQWQARAQTAEADRARLAAELAAYRSQVAELERDGLWRFWNARARAYLARATAAEAQVARMRQAVSLATDILVTVETDAVSYPRLYKKAAAAVKAIRALASPAQEPQDAPLRALEGQE